LTFQLKQIIIRGACVDRVDCQLRRWWSVSRDRTQRHPPPKHFYISLGNWCAGNPKIYMRTLGGSGISMHLYERAWHNNSLFMGAM